MEAAFRASSLAGIGSFVVMVIAVALAGVAVTIYARIDDWKRGLR